MAGSSGNLDDTALINRQLDDFRILSKLGSGGMAKVYLAEQLSLKRNVAIKILQSDKLSAADAVMVKRFDQEARAAAGLNHPNIVQVYSVGHEDDLHFIAQEYVHGLNLLEYLRRNGPPSVQVCLHIMRQTSAALVAAGDAGIVHRDIKPENILVTRKGEVKVADFGLAQLSRNEENLYLTQEGKTIGTPMYMSPEQISDSQVDCRSDIYSVGATFYHLLTGRPPFQGGTVTSVVVQHLQQAPLPVGERREDLPPALCEIVHRALEKDPAQRYPDARSLLKDIKLVLKDFQQGGEPRVLSQLVRQVTPESRRPLAARLWSVGRGSRGVYLGICLLVFLLCAVIGWWLKPAGPLLP
ncbi:MAG: serine/threonine-protein kinase [Planctomycetaceae bacterium]